MTAIEGFQLNSPRAPQVRKKMPAPFARPSITIGGSPIERKSWKTVQSQDIKVGDIVPGVGRVYEVNEVVDRSVMLTSNPPQFPWTVTVKGGLGNVKTYQGGELVWAFTASDGAE